jgi:adenylate kinase family enzyme
MGKEYLTIAEYAEIKGISKQAVYKQLNNKLKDYVEIVENKKCLKISVLEESIQPYSTKVEQPIQPVSTEVEQPIQPVWEAQLKEKDKTIDSLLRQIEALQKQNDRLTDLLQNSQMLLAVEKQQMISAQEAKTEDTAEPIQQKPKKKLFDIFRR